MPETPLRNPKGAGRKALAPGQHKLRRQVYMPPELDGWLVDQVGTGRGAVEREVVRILELYRREV